MGRKEAGKKAQERGQKIAAKMAEERAASAAKELEENAVKAPASSQKIAGASKPPVANIQPLKNEMVTETQFPIGVEQEYNDCILVVEQEARDGNYFGTPRHLAQRDECGTTARRNIAIATAPPPSVKRKKTGSATIDQALQAKLKRQSPQNFLIQNMRTFAAYADGIERDLANLITVSKYKGNLINKLTSSSKLQPLMDATPLELSQLTPFFRLMKKHAGGTVQDFRFMDHLKWDYRDADGTIRPLRSSQGQGVGFKSFKWDTTGTNMFSAPRTLMATLTLHFQSISELVRGASLDESEGPLWQDLIVPQKGRLHPRTECPTGYEDLDQHIRKLTSKNILRGADERPDHKAPDPDFSVMVQIGWKYGLKNELPQSLRDAVDASRIILNLGLRTHRFKFREDGTIDLEIEYMARLEGIMEDYGGNLLALGNDGANQKLVEQLEAKRNEMSRLTTAINSATGEFNCAEELASERQRRAIDSREDAIDQEIGKLEKQVEAVVKRLKVSMYGKFAQHLIDESKMHFIDVATKDYANGKLDAMSHFYRQDAVLVDRGNSIPPLSDGTRRAVQQVSRGRGDDRHVSNTQLKKRVYASIQNNKACGPGYQRLAFFFLGDLINFFAGALPAKDKATNDKFEIILGDLTFLDFKEVGGILPGKEKFEALNETAQANIVDVARDKIYSDLNTYQITANMARVPISFAAYSKWFTAEIINNGNTSLTFKGFMESLTTKLLVGALETTENQYVNADLRRALKERNRVRPGMAYGANPQLARGNLTTEHRRANGESNLRIAPKPIPASEGGWDAPAAATLPLSSRQKYLYSNRQFFVLSVTRLPWSSQVVDEEVNASEGVYHLKIGASGGLVKRIDLQREGNARIRDANIMRAYNNGGTGLGIIQEPYNATVTLFGSALFQPGQYVYLNPTNIGLGTGIERYSIARQLGIGGFYLVTKVSTTISEGKLESTLKCVFQNYGYLPDSRQAGASSDPPHQLDGPQAASSASEWVGDAPSIGETPAERADREQKFAARSKAWSEAETKFDESGEDFVSRMEIEGG